MDMSCGPVRAAQPPSHELTVGALLPNLCQNNAFQVRLETWGSSTEAGIRGALQGIDSALRTTVNNLGNTGRDNSAPSWRGTAADPVDIILRRSMGAGNNDDYFPDVRPGPRGGLAPHTRAQSVSLSVGAFRV